MEKVSSDWKLNMNKDLETHKWRRRAISLSARENRKNKFLEQNNGAKGIADAPWDGGGLNLGRLGEAWVVAQEAFTDFGLLFTDNRKLLEDSWLWVKSGYERLMHMNSQRLQQHSLDLDRFKSKILHRVGEGDSKFSWFCFVLFFGLLYFACLIWLSFWEKQNMNLVGGNLGVGGKKKRILSTIL